MLRLGVVALGIAGTLAAVAAGNAADAPGRGSIARGRYLVDAVMACNSCHTPRGARGLDMTRRFAGGTEVWETPDFVVQGSNISSDRETGIGGWSVADIKRLLTEGVRPDGTRVAPQMPYGLYRVLTPNDLDSVARYVKSIEPVRHKMPAPVYKTDLYAGPPLAPIAATATVPADPVARGRYLASLAYCMACHARRPDGVVDVKNWAGRGGFVMKGTFGVVRVSNITSDPVKGVGALTDAQLKRALTKGIGHDGRAFILPMARQAFYSKLTRVDLDAIVAWIRSLPLAS